MPGTLYVVATPLGNLEDLSPRAIRVLKEVDLIACEDTRHSRKLLSHFGIQTATTSYHEHNEEPKTLELIGLLEQGKQVALVSDAGTPLISDPGYRLVGACREKGIPVYAIPGPSATTAALSISGLPTDRFFFAGFLPRRAAACRSELEKISALGSTLIFYLSPHGLIPTLTRILQTLGNRRAFLVRELSKVHETHYLGPLEDILRSLQKESPRGEYTLLVEGKVETVLSPPSHQPLDLAAYVTGLMQHRGLSRKEAIKRAARELGLSRQEVYKKALAAFLCIFWA